MEGGTAMLQSILAWKTRKATSANGGHCLNISGSSSKQDTNQWSWVIVSPITSLFLPSVREIKMEEVLHRLQKQERRPLICLDTAQIACPPPSTASQEALWIRKWVGLRILEPLEVWPAPQGSKMSYDSHGETNSIVKVKTTRDEFLSTNWWCQQSAPWDYKRVSLKLQFEVSPTG